MPGCSSGTPSLQLPSAPSLDCCTSMPCHAAQVARPWFCELFKLGMPRLGSQVAHPSDILGLACHAFDSKWHTVVKVLLGMESWRATPLCSSGMPIVVDKSGMPRPFCVLHSSSLEFCASVPRPVSGVPRPYACFESLF
ncbi:uncharacterized protein DS421_16g544600 [Arachis hypogaea]|nr:uncharacterized protein DS421_16g544600 [Arachis hypogaea]